MPQVLNRKHTIDWPQDAVYIGRPGPWGNPYRIGVDGTREQVVEKYKAMVKSSPTLLTAIRNQLQGKDLVCWCAPLPCHGDILLKIANPEEV